MTGGLAYFVVIRTHGDTRAVMPAMVKSVSSLDANVPLTAVASGTDLVEQALESQRSLSLLVTSFALVAIVLSVIGIYGVMAFFVEQNRKDISIRLALGAGANEVLRLVV